MLIQASRAVCIPGIQFACHAKMHKPVHLDRLPVSLWLVGGNYITVGCNLKKLFSAPRIPLLCCQFTCICSISFPKYHDCIAGQLHAFQFILLIKCFRIVHKIQLVDRILNIFFVIQKTFFINFHRANRMSRPSLLHKFCKNAGLIGVFPLRCHLAENTAPHRTLFPVWNHDFFLYFIVCFLYPKVNQVSVVHDMHIFHCMTAQLRKCRSRLRGIPFLPHNQLALTDIQRFC